MDGMLVSIMDGMFFLNLYPLLAHWFICET